MTSIERTAYPRFKRGVSERELNESFTPSLQEMEWAEESTRFATNQFGLLVLLKSFERLGYFPSIVEVPSAVIKHVCSACGFDEDMMAAWPPATRTLEHHKVAIRKRVGVVHDPPGARKLAEEAIRVAAVSKDNPADLINFALEELIKLSYELPGFTTLDELASSVRVEVNHEYMTMIVDRLDPVEEGALLGLLDVEPGRLRTRFDDLKKPARQPTLSNLRSHTRYLRGLDAIGATGDWLEGVPPAKIDQFAAQARVLDATELGKHTGPKRLALLVCVVHKAREKARDELAEMLCRRMRLIHKNGMAHLEQIREQHRQTSERMIGVLGKMLHAARGVLDEDHPEGTLSQSDVIDLANVDFAALGMAMFQPIIDAGGISQLQADHVDISAHHNNNYMPLLSAKFRSHRSAMFDIVELLDLESTSNDTAVLDAVEFIGTLRHRRSDFVEDTHNGSVLDISFCNRNWAATIRRPDEPGRFDRRHIEVCVFAYLARELRSGDIAVNGAASYANLFDQLLTEAEVETLIPSYCAEVGLPSTATEFCNHMRDQLSAMAAQVDDQFPFNSDLTFNEHGRPSLKRHGPKHHPETATALADAIETKTKEVSLLDIITRTAHRTGFHHHFGPLSGSDPKITDSLGRYSIIAFTYGTNMGPHQMSRHIKGVVSPKEISIPATRHITATKLNKASAAVMDAYMQLDIVGYWGDGPAVGADGTQIDTWDDNLLAETSVRYGGYGGIAYRHIADTYIALFTRFIPCGVWEAVHIFSGLLDHESETIEPDTIHADTQGQSLPVFGLATLLGIELLPRIRNWKDLNFYRPTPASRYRHIDTLFDDKPIDWELIQTHWIDLMRVIISIRQGTISTPTLLRRLSNRSRKNRIYKAFRELGRITRTIVLLQYLSDPELPVEITAVTNRVESFHGFAAWLAFGNGILATNDPEQMEKLVKFNELVANCVIYYNAIEQTRIINQLVASGWPMNPDDIGILSPYGTKRVLRFGDYTLDITPPPPADTQLQLPAPPEPQDD